MKILAAFDSFKESMSAYDAGMAVKEATAHEVKICPLADGGEGTMEAINTALGGEIHALSVHGPLNTPVNARYALCDDLAIIECAQACGLDLLRESEKDALHTTTRGVGEMILDAYEHNARRFMITLGGSATNDGGIGMLAALGYRFLDEKGNEVELSAAGLEDIVTVDPSSYVLQNADVVIVGACDVDNPLTGKNGATYIFGGQKGIKEKDFVSIDAAMAHYATLSEKTLGKHTQEMPGTGAAGGLGFAIVTYLNGRLEPGFDIVGRITDLETKIGQADLVFTGEGKIDKQTLSGKTPYGVLRLAKKHNKPVVIFAGKVADAELLKRGGFTDVRCINHDQAPLARMLKEGPERLKEEVIRYFYENQE